MNFLRAYVMTSDTGFAPNPYHGILTLATCKPVIRRCAQAGDWIGGWTGVKVVNKYRKAIPFSNGQKLIYLARISEVIKMEEYWNRFPQKRPVESAEPHSSEVKCSCGSTTKPIEQPKKGCGGGCADRGDTPVVQDCGDNIYEYTDGKWIHHGLNHIGCDTHDLSGKNVLLCEEFYYFGVDDGRALDVSQIISYRITRGDRKLGLDDSNVEQLIEYVRKHAASAAIKGIKQ